MSDDSGQDLQALQILPGMGAKHITRLSENWREVSDTSRQFWYNYPKTNQWEIERK